jgi:hypothetical protein
MPSKEDAIYSIPDHLIAKVRSKNHLSKAQYPLGMAIKEREIVATCIGV